MPATRSGRLLFLLIVFACLFVIGRNLYRRQLNERLYAAVQRSDLAAVRDLVARHADVNYIHPREDGLNKMPPGVRDDFFEQSVMLAAISQMRNQLNMTGPGVSDQRMLEQKMQRAEAIACLLVRNGINLGVDGKRGRDYLKSACASGNIALVQCLLDRGVDPNKRDAGEGSVIDSALNYSAVSWQANGQSNVNSQEHKQRLLRSRQVVQLLRERKARITAAQAVQLDDNALLKSVLDAGESANQRDQYGQFALELAAEKQDIEAVKMLLAHEAEVDAHVVYNNTSINGTALCTAASNGNRRLVELLLAHGANVNFRAIYTTPLLSAAQMKRSDIFRLLLAHGADPNLRPLNLEQGSLLAAVIGNLPQFVPELLKRGVDPKGRNGDTLQAAIRAHRLDLVREFLRRGVPVNLPWISKMPYYVPAYPQYNPLTKRADKYQIYAFSPLGIAVCGATECEALLLRAGAKLGPDAPSILAAAARAGRADIFARLLALGADVNGIDSDKETALTQAIVYAPDGVETLLRAGANPNYVNRNQSVPLAIASAAGDVKTMRLLLAHGANVNAHPPRGHTALYYARKKKNAAVVALLEKTGAKDDR